MTLYETEYAPNAAAPMKRPIRRLSTLRFRKKSVRVPKTRAPKPPRSMRLAREKVNRGLQGMNAQRSTVEVKMTAVCWATMAHGPNPLAASVIPTTAPTTAPAIFLISSARKFISRVSSADWIVASDVTAKPSESTMNSGWTSGCP